MTSATAVSTTTAIVSSDKVVTVSVNEWNALNEKVSALVELYMYIWGARSTWECLIVLILNIWLIAERCFDGRDLHSFTQGWRF